MTRVRRGQIAAPISRDQFRERYYRAFKDPAYQAEWQSIVRIEAIAWDGYTNNRKSPLARKAGEGYADPDLSTSCPMSGAQRAQRSMPLLSDRGTRQRPPACS